MKRILLVEDSRTQAERLRLLLSREGHDVEVAATGEDGLRSVEESRPDLVISDVMMPKMDGFEMCRALKENERTRRVPVILLTSRTSPADIITGLDAGADNFIPKPYDDDHLIERVRRIFEHLQLRERQSLDMEVHLTIGGRKVTVTADRQQIIELLFSTFEQMSKNFDELAHANQELQEARVEAERANRAKSRFLSRMSHELRTPLTSIIGFAQLLETSEMSDRDRECIKTIGQAGGHLLELINELLDIGRIEADEITLSLEPVTVAAVHDEVISLIVPQSTERGVRIQHESPPVALRALADPLRLKQVLLNLVSNAVKYNQDGGVVRIEWTEAGDRVVLRVADTGIGIEPEKLDRLFAPFDRIEVERKTDVQGTGLGLSVSKRLIELMGGRVTVESEVDVGTTFSVDLPLAPVKRDEPDLAVTEAGASPDRARTVLYIEDEQSTFLLIDRILQERLGITPIHARSSDALDLARRYRPGVIILDGDVPDPPADQIVRELRSDPVTRGIPLIVLSADVATQQSPDLRAASGCLQKPLDIDRFVTRVRDHLPASPRSADNGYRSTGSEEAVSSMPGKDKS